MIKELEDKNVIFCDTDTALKKYPDLFKEYFNNLVKYDENKYTVSNIAISKKKYDDGHYDIDEFIEKIEKLQEIGVDVSKIVRSDTILKLVGKTLEEPEEVLIKKIKGMGLEPDYNIGSKLSDLKKVYNKNQRGEKTGGTIATEEQVRRIRSFGIKIGKEITGQSIGQASYTATVQECDEAQSDLSKLLDKQKNQQEV